MKIRLDKNKQIIEQIKKQKTFSTNKEKYPGKE